MKTPSRILGCLAAALALGMAGLVAAQPGPGVGAGPGMQGAGPGSRAGAGMRGMRFDQNNTRGWALMTAEERAAHQAKMRAVKTYDECKQLQDEQHQALQARARKRV